MTEFELAYRNEALLSPGHHPEPAIPDPILGKWQDIVNVMAEMLDVPAGLIMRILGEEIHVFVSSSTEGNPYHRGDSQHLWGSGLYGSERNFAACARLDHLKIDLMRR